MIEPKLNETLTIDGKTVKCVEENGSSCQGCMLEKVDYSICKEIHCSDFERKDGKDIILILV